MPVGDARAVADRRDLRDADPRDDARRADAPGPDPDLHGVRPRVDERFGRLCGRDVPRDDLDVRVPLLRLAYGVDDPLRVPVRGVDHDDVHAGGHEHLGPSLAIRAWADRGADAEAPLLVFARLRVTVGLKDVLDRDEADELAVVHDEELLDPVLVQKKLRVIVRRRRRHRHELLRHERRDRLVEVLFEADVARRQDPNGGLRLDDGDAADVVLLHDVERLAQRLVRPRGDGRRDHAALGPLDALHLEGLRLGIEVLVEDPNPPSRAIVMAVRASVTESIAADRSGTFSSNRFGQPGLRIHVLREHLAVGRREEDVVEGEALAETVFDHGDPWRRRRVCASFGAAA